MIMNICSSKQTIEKLVGQFPKYALFWYNDQSQDLHILLKPGGTSSHGSHLSSNKGTSLDSFLTFWRRKTPQRKRIPWYSIKNTKKTSSVNSWKRIIQTYIQYIGVTLRRNIIALFHIIENTNACSIECIYSCPKLNIALLKNAKQETISSKILQLWKKNAIQSLCEDW